MARRHLGRRGRRHPRRHPTGSGRDDLPQVLVRGTATCPEEVRTDPAGLEGYWRRLYRIQPSGAAYLDDRVARRLMDVYWFRLVLTITPTDVQVRPAATADRPTAVLSWRDADGGPRSARVHLEDPDGGSPDASLVVLAAPDEPLAAGPASVLVHSHDALVDHQRTRGTAGRLVAAGTGWRFVPERSLGGISAGDPLTVLRTMLGMRRTAARYLRRRGLARPVVPFDAYRALAREAAGTAPADA